MIIENGVLIKVEKDDILGGFLSIPSEVVEIGKDACKSQTGLKFLSLPEGIQIIGENAFDDCIYLIHVTLPNSLKEIGRRAFSCTALENIIIPSGVKKVDEYAFFDCEWLQTVVAPKKCNIASNSFSSSPIDWGKGEMITYAHSKIKTADDGMNKK